MQKHHLLERRVSLKDSTKLGENYRPHNSTGKQQTCYVSLKKKKKTERCFRVWYQEAQGQN